MKLKVDNICISFDGKRILENLNLDVKAGEFVSVIGPSGCGKSTFLNILAGVKQAEAGTIELDGRPLHGKNAHFAYMPQEDLLLDWMKIIDNITLYGKLHGIDQKVQAMELLKQFHLDEYADRYPHELSGGMRQRAAFLRTMLCEADILLLDEPFGALDVITRGEIQDFIMELKQHWNKTVIMVTHDLDEALYLSDRVVVLQGSPAKVCDIVDVNVAEKNRQWLYAQSALRLRLHEVLQDA